MEQLGRGQRDRIDLLDGDLKELVGRIRRSIEIGMQIDTHDHGFIGLELDFLRERTAERLARRANAVGPRTEQRRGRSRRRGAEQEDRGDHA